MWVKISSYDKIFRKTFVNSDPRMHIGGGIFDLVLKGVPDVAEVWVGSPVRRSDHIVIFIGVVLEQPKPHLVCRQAVFLKNSVNWQLVRENVKSLNWNEILSFPCPLLSLNGALLRVIRNRVLKQMSLVRGVYKHWLTVGSREHIGCGI